MDSNTKALATAAYNKATALIETVFETFESYCQSIGESFDVRASMNRFDALLQFSLIEMAIADKDFDLEEVKFIRDLSRYCDFCEYLNQTGGSSISWNDLYNAKISTLNKLLETCKTEMAKLNQEFVSLFTIVDKAITELDLISMLKDAIFNIFTALAGADGDYSKKELRGDYLIFIALMAIEQNL